MNRKKISEAIFMNAISVFALDLIIVLKYIGVRMKKRRAFAAENS
jgi:hypothetical protein